MASIDAARVDSAIPDPVASCTAEGGWSIAHLTAARFGWLNLVDDGIISREAAKPRSREAAKPRPRSSVRV